MHKAQERIEWQELMGSGTLLGGSAVKKVAISVRARLLNLSRASGGSFNKLLEHYATGRFLWRLGESDYRERFILKGAQLFRLWDSELHRPTRDLICLGSKIPQKRARYDFERSVPATK